MSEELIYVILIVNLAVVTMVSILCLAVIIKIDNTMKEVLNTLRYLLDSSRLSR